MYLFIFFVFCFQNHSFSQNETVLIKTLHHDRYGTSIPYVAVCGVNLENISCSHVIFDTTAIDFDSIIFAFDFLFKYMHVTGMTYPAVSLNSWEFLHHTVYKLPRSTKSMSVVSTIKTLTAMLVGVEKKFYAPKDSSVVSENPAAAGTPILLVNQQVSSEEVNETYVRPVLAIAENDSISPSLMNLYEQYELF